MNELTNEWINTINVFYILFYFMWVIKSKDLKSPNSKPSPQEHNSSVYENNALLFVPQLWQKITEMHLKVISFFYKTTKSIMHNHNWLSSPFAFIQYVKFSSICRKWEHLFGRNDSSVQWCSKQNLLTGVVEEQEQYYGCLMKIQPVSSWDLYDMNPRSPPVRTNCSSVM